MLKIDRNQKTLTTLEAPSLAESEITERYDLQEFISNSSDEFFEELGEELFLIGKEMLPSQTVQDRIDLLAIDKEGTSVIIELKRGNNKLQMMQAISYAGMISHWAPEDFESELSVDRQEALSEFLECDGDNINRTQRVILIAEAFDYALLIGAEWLGKQFNVGISCCRVAMATDNVTNSEYLVCSNVYPTPELVNEATARGGAGSLNRRVKWPDWETALANITNQNVVDYFLQQVAADCDSYLRGRIVRYRFDGKRRLSVAARQRNGYVWQQGRFENDIEFWKKRISDSDCVKPVKDGACLRMSLESKEDFEAFHQAAATELQSVNWVNESPDAELENEDE